MRNFRKHIFMQVALSGVCANPSFASAEKSLNAENIARSSMNVAVSTRSFGRCYAAVARALNPLGVKLTGASAYMARPQLLQDPRFVPLVVTDVAQLWRGDIVVYQKSNSHPHGHICVYEGNFLEASDHVAKVTHTEAYGGATVFRLRDELPARQFMRQADYPTAGRSIANDVPEPYSNYGAVMTPASYAGYAPSATSSYTSYPPPAPDSTAPMRSASSGTFARAIKSSIIRSVTRRAVHLLMDSL